MIPADERAEYHASPGLSASGMKDLLVSPLRYWSRWINPARVEPEPTSAMRVGSALHCAVLEFDKYDSRYACEFNPPDECLDTIDQLRAFIVNCGKKPTGTRKADIIAQVQAISMEVPIKDVLEKQHLELHAGKTILTIEEWNRVSGMAEALRSEPRVNDILEKGQPEVWMKATDPETKAELRGLLDWVVSPTVLDLKTFTNSRGKSIDKTVADAVYYEGYYRQGWFYAWLRELNGLPDTQFVFAFVESEEPHETRIKVLNLKDSLYAEQAQREVRSCIEIYAEHLKRFGEKPWRSAQEVTPLMDEEMRGLYF